MTPLTRSHRFLAQLLASPWAMDPAAMAMYASLIVNGYAAREGFVARHVPQSPAGDARADAPSATRQRFARAGSIAVVPVRGPIVQRASQIGACEDGIGCDQIEMAMAEAVADDTVEHIVATFDTPGGSVYGLPELADKWSGWAAVKPIYGIADSMSASAGYWLMSQCTECYVTPSGQVGSIGVYSAHDDISQALQQAGISITLISAGKYKTEGNPYGPLPDEARANMQEGIDDYYRMFTAAVARGRRVAVDAVVSGMGEGRCPGAQCALAAGLVDGVMPFSALLARLQSQPSTRPASAAASRGRRAEGGLSVESAQRRLRLAELS